MGCGASSHHPITAHITTPTRLKIGDVVCARSDRTRTGKVEEYDRSSNPFRVRWDHTGHLSNWLAAHDVVALSDEEVCQRESKYGPVLAQREEQQRRKREEEEAKKREREEKRKRIGSVGAVVCSLTNRSRTGKLEVYDGSLSPYRVRWDDTDDLSGGLTLEDVDAISDEEKQEREAKYAPIFAHREEERKKREKVRTKEEEKERKKHEEEKKERAKQAPLEKAGDNDTSRTDGLVAAPNPSAPSIPAPLITGAPTQKEFDELKQALADGLKNVEDMKKKIASSLPLASTSGLPADTDSTAALLRAEAAEGQLADLHKQNAALKKELEKATGSQEDDILMKTSTNNKIFTASSAPSDLPYSSPSDSDALFAVFLAFVKDPEGFFERGASENYGDLSVEDFKRACKASVPMKGISEGALKSIFCQLDRDNRGMISLEDLTKATEVARHFYKEAMVEDVILATLVQLSKRESNGEDLAHLSFDLVRGAVKDKVPEALAKRAEEVRDMLGRKEKADKKQKDQGIGKFAMATYGEATAYDEGLSSIGTPHPNIFEHIQKEATEGPDSEDAFTTWNSGEIHTSPLKEWDFVFDPFQPASVNKDTPLNKWIPKHVYGGNRAPIRLRVFLHATSAMASGIRFGDYKKAHELPETYPQWLHIDEVDLVKVITLRFVKSQLDAVSLINAFSKKAALKGTYKFEWARMKVGRIIDALSEGLREKDGSASSCSYKFLVGKLTGKDIATKEEIEAILDHYHAKLAEANMSEAEVIGLREYSGPLYFKMNSSLRLVGVHVEMAVMLPCALEICTQDFQQMFKAVVAAVAHVEPEVVSMDFVSELHTASTRIEVSVGVPPQPEGAEQVRTRLTELAINSELAHYQEMASVLAAAVLVSPIGAVQPVFVEGEVAEAPTEKVSTKSESSGVQNWRYSEFINAVEENQVKKVAFSADGERVLIVDIDGNRFKLDGLTPNDPSLLDTLRKKKVDITVLPDRISNISVDQPACVVGLSDHLKGNRYVNSIYACSSAMRKISHVSCIPKGRRVFRGIREVKLPKKFVTEKEGGGRGGVDYAFMSTTTRREVAVNYINEKEMPILFECEVDDLNRGCPLAFVSQFPAEDEVLIPAMSYIEITGNPYVMETSKDSGAFVTVYPGRIHCNQKSQTIDEIEARRKHDILSMTFYIEQELLRDLTAVLEVLPKLLENQTEVMDQARTKALDDFGTLRKKWHTCDAKDFNNDKKYKDDIVKAIEFKVEKIIELGQLVYKADNLHPDNFLHVVTRNGNAELSTILLSLGFPLHPADNINYKDDMGETILATACRMCNFEVFEKLLKAGADVNVVRRDGKSALHLAIMLDSARSFEMFEALLEAKADVNLINGDGASALHLASASNSARSFEMLEALLEAGADLKLDAQDSMGETVLATACRVGNFEVFEKLLKAGADVNVVRRDGKSALHLAIMSDSARSFEMFEALLEVKADVNVINGDGASALHLASASDSARSFEMLEALLETGADLKLDAQDSMGETVLATACRVGNFEVFEKLLKAGADVNVVRRDGKSALHLAIMSDSARSSEMFEALLEAKADVNVINGDGASALHLASASDSARSFEMLETLLKAGADVYVVRPDGASALAMTIVSGNARMLNCMPKMIQYDESAESSYVRCLSLAFLEPNNIFRWLKDGRSPRELLGVLCALMASAAAERPMQDRLSHVRAFINCHIDLLQDPSPLAPLTVTDVVEQLALQESDSVFASDAAAQWTASIQRGVVWVNKPALQHACRWTIKADVAVRCVAYAADGSRLARAEGNDVVVCDAVSGFQVHRFKGHSSNVASVAFSADGTVIASGSEDRTVRLWDVETGSCKCTLSGHSDCVNSVAWIKDSTMLASGSDDRTVKLWNTNTGDCVSTLTGHSDWVRSVAFSADGTMLASSSHDRTVKLWNTNTGECESTLSGHSDCVNSVAWIKDGTMLASGSDDSTVKLWNTNTGDCVSTLTGHRNCVVSVAWNNDGTKLASGSYDTTVRIWSVGSAGTFECESTLSGHSRAVSSVSFSPDGKQVASGSWDESIRIWETSTGTCVSTLNGHSNTVTSVVWNNDGTKLASGSYDKTVRIWSVASTGTFECESTLCGHSDWVRSVAWSPDGKNIASGSRDKTIKVWNAQTGQCVSTLTGHSGAVTQVEFAHDGATLVSGGRDGKTRYWDVQSGEAKSVVEGSKFAFSKGSSGEQKVGKFLITAEGDILRIFRSEGGVTDKADKDTVPVAFFRAPAPIVTVDTYGAHIAVGCQNGEVLQLRAAVLLTGV